MIPDLIYTSRGLNASNQINSRPTYLLSDLGATILYIKCLGHLINILTNKANIGKKEKF